MEFDPHTFILGIIQGLCEFLPLSSSGHLALLQTFFGFSQDGLLVFDLLLHCSTVLVVLIFFRQDILRLMSGWTQGLFSRAVRKREEWAYAWCGLLAVAATGAVGLPLKGVVERMMSSPIAVGCGLLVTAGLLFLVPLFMDRKMRLSPGKALLIGLVQGLAVLPGVSRSGSTIAMGLILGLAVEEAFRFSFLISVPAVLGASLLEGIRAWRSGVVLLPQGWLWAALAAFFLGWLALKLLHRLVLSGRWAYFGIYCLLLGCAAILTGLKFL